MGVRYDQGSGFNTDGGIHEIPLPRAGRLWLCGKHYIAPKPHQVVAEFAIDHVVCLVERHELAHRYDPYVEWLEANRGGRATWNPLHDLSYPPLDDAMRLLRPLHAMLMEGRTMLVHCAAGIGRAGTTATALVMLQGMDVPDAMQVVRMNRPSAGPESGPQQQFIDQLRDELNRNGDARSPLE